MNPLAEARRGSSIQYQKTKKKKQTSTVVQHHHHHDDDEPIISSEISSSSTTMIHHTTKTKKKQKILSKSTSKHNKNSNNNNAQDIWFRKCHFGYYCFMEYYIHQHELWNKTMKKNSKSSNNNHHHHTNESSSNNNNNNIEKNIQPESLSSSSISLCRNSIGNSRAAKRRRRKQQQQPSTQQIVKEEKDDHHHHHPQHSNTHTTTTIRTILTPQKQPPASSLSLQYHSTLQPPPHPLRHILLQYIQNQSMIQNQLQYDYDQFFDILLLQPLPITFRIRYTTSMYQQHQDTTIIQQKQQQQDIVHEINKINQQYEEYIKNTNHHHMDHCTIRSTEQSDTTTTVQQKSQQSCHYIQRMFHNDDDNNNINNSITSNATNKGNDDRNDSNNHHTTPHNGTTITTTNGTNTTTTTIYVPYYQVIYDQNYSTMKRKYDDMNDTNHNTNNHNTISQQQQQQSIQSSVKEFLLHHHQNGNIARQEVGSMLPITILYHLGYFHYSNDSQYNDDTTNIKQEKHTVGHSTFCILDMCSSPGSKLLQTLEILLVIQQQNNNNNQYKKQIETTTMSNSMDETRTMSKNIKHHATSPKSMTKKRTFKIFANDILPSRIVTLQQAVERSGMNQICHMYNNNNTNINQYITYTCQDASKFILRHSIKQSKQKRKPDDIVSQRITKVLQFDVILCDVPCSGDGTIRKDQHIISIWKPNIGNILHTTQLSILLRAIQLVLPETGIICYSTCSLNPIENEAVVLAALQQYNNNNQNQNEQKPKSNEYMVELIDIPKIDNVILRDGISNWKVAEYEPNHNDKHDILDDDDTNVSQQYLQWYDSYEDYIIRRSNIPQQQLLPSTLWPSTTNSVNDTTTIQQSLSKCKRLWPSDQDTGGFFIALIRKIKRTTKT